MIAPNLKLEICRKMISELRWTERHAEQSARIAVSKALWLGIEKDDVLRLIRAVPSATYIRQCPHILTQTWEAIAKVEHLEKQFNEFDQILNALN